jgi:hypothetical protein
VSNSMIEAVTAGNRVLDIEEFGELSFEAKRSYLQVLPPKERLEMILEDRDDRKLTWAMQPQEVYWLFKEVGGPDALELLALTNPAQFLFVLDMELWQGWSFKEDKAVEYLGYLLKGGEEQFLQLLPQLDFNLLSLLLCREITVAGGIGDLNSDEERLTDWDQTFDDVFLIKYRNPNHSQTVSTFLEMLCRHDNSLYTALMESVSGDIDIEMEEESYRVKSGRLADLGFPPHDEAMEIYSRINPDTFIPSGNKALLDTSGATALPATLLTGKTFLERVLSRVDTESLRMELNYLVNTALVADQAHLVDTAYMRATIERVYGYLNIALEHLCHGDEAKGASVLTGESLKTLFQLGFSILLKLKFRAEKIVNSSPETDKILSGLKCPRPLYYCGLDIDRIDSYREFRELLDVETVSSFLLQLEER